MKHFALLAACCIFFGGVFGQSYSFLSYSTSDGLPQSQVQCIGQDSSGYLWVGTLGGLAKFNGKKFINYSVNDGLLNNRITSISMIGGKIWVGHEGGVSAIGPDGKARKWSFSDAINKKSNVTDIVSFNGLTVIATNFGVLYTINDKQQLRPVTSMPEDTRQYNDLLVIGKRLLIAYEGGIYETRDLRTFRHNTTFGSRNITGFALKKNGQLWVSTFESGLFRTDTQLSKADSIPLLAQDFQIKKCLVDDRQQIWLSSRFGIIRIDPYGRQLLINDTNGLPIASTKCIFEDRDGTIWVGTDGKGLLRFTGEQFVHYKESPQFPTELFLSVTKRKDGTYFFGSYDKGLFQKKENGPLLPVGIPGTTIWSLKTASDGTIWCATDIGLSAYRPSGKIENYSLRVEGSRVTVIERIQKNKLYVGGSTGIGVIENGVYRLLLSHNFESAYGTVRAFASYRGKVLFASDNGLFELVDGKSAKRFSNFRNGVVSMVVDNANHLWIGTESGLYLLKEGKFVQHPLAKDPSSNTINFLEVIGNRLYIGTNNGLFEMNTLRLSVDHHYGVNRGLINLESNINSSFYDGRYLWFGTAEGLIQFDPLHSTAESQRAPILNIGSILLNYAPFDYADYATGMNQNGFPSGLRLPYSMNNLTFELDGILLSNPEGLRYQFWLEGYDDTWSKPVGNATVTLSNLPDGDHILHLRAVDEFGTFSNVIELPIRITPPFWRTWWFYSIIALIILFGIRAYFRWQIRQERERNYKKNLEYKTRLLALEQQSLNASMNRHFIFNSLNSIQYFINTQDKLSANRYLTNFAKLIRKNLDSAAETDNMVTLQQEIDRLELYLSLEAMRFKDRFTYNISVDPRIDAESVIVPGMLLQPFIENSIIHGILPNETVKGHIEVAMKLTEQHLEITIDDNGIGIDYSLEQKQLVNGDHKSQGMEITAKRIDIIRELSKKDFELEGPFQTTNSDSSIKGTRVLLKIPIDNLDV